jgi:choline dehydrogenase-like flavoprotein
MRMMRRLAATRSLGSVIDSETLPGPEVGDSDQELLDAFRRYGQSGYHTCGTCRMGASPESPVDPALRVRGVTGLRVMDLSVTPTMVSGNTNGPVMAMAWHAADLILKGPAGAVRASMPLKADAPL